MKLSINAAALLERVINNTAYLCILRKEDVETVTEMFGSLSRVDMVAEVKASSALRFPFLFSSVPVDRVWYEIVPFQLPALNNPLPKVVVYYNKGVWGAKLYPEFCNWVTLAEQPKMPAQTEAKVPLLNRVIEGTAYLCILRREHIPAVKAAIANTAASADKAADLDKCLQDVTFPVLVAYSLTKEGYPGWVEVTSGIFTRDVVCLSMYGDWLIDSYSEYLTKLRDYKEVELGEVPAPPAETPTHDPVKNPAHYTRGKIETWDFITSHDMDYLDGNVVKYLSRAGLKRGAPIIEDLNKAKAYLEKKMSVLAAKGITGQRDYPAGAIGFNEYAADRDLSMSRFCAIWCICLGEYRLALKNINDELNYLNA